MELSKSSSQGVYLAILMQKTGNKVHRGQMAYLASRKN